jgi:TRAP-type uncharacterized transport system fused permease subunit
VRIAIMALIPAILYFFSAGWYTQFHGMRIKENTKIRNLKLSDEKVDVRRMVVYGPLFFVPLAVMIALIIIGFSASYSVGVAIVILFFLSLLRKETRSSPKRSCRSRNLRGRRCDSGLTFVHRAYA